MILTRLIFTKNSFLPCELRKVVMAEDPVEVSVVWNDEAHTMRVSQRLDSLPDAVAFLLVHSSEFEAFVGG